MHRRTPRSFLLVALGILVLPGALAAQQISLHVNLPAYRLDVYRGEERLRSYTVGVGSPDFPTPMGAFELEEIEWNPWWNPPASPWARGEKRTPPGPGNPMGRAKVAFLPLFYFHGSTSGFGRASSHGCVRMRNEDVLDLARLLAIESGAAIGAEEIRALERNSGRTRRIALPAGIPVRIVYRLAEEIDGRVHVHDDIYDMGMTARERALAARALGAGG
jgi:murein L,D-transpeptidase YcbB/YkuD